MPNMTKTRPAESPAATFLPFLVELMQKRDEIYLRRLRKAAAAGDLSKALQAGPIDKGAFTTFDIDREDIPWGKNWRARATQAATSCGGAPPYLQRIDKLVETAIAKAAADAFTPAPTIPGSSFNDRPGKGELASAAVAITAAAMMIASKYAKDAARIREALARIVATNGGDLAAAQDLVVQRIERGLL